MSIGVSGGLFDISGQTDSGEYRDLAVTPEGHLEVAIHGPTLPFGAIHAERLKPIFQVDPVYGLNTTESVATTGINGPGSTSASVTATSNVFKCSTGTTSLSFASLQSRKRLRYRPGQGAVVRFTAGFSTPVASSILVAGCGTSESGFYFGYNGTSFGILHVTGGVREIQTLTVTTASTATNDYVVTLAGTAHTVTATNNSSTTKTAYEIAQGTYPGWKAEAIGATVIFLADAVGDKSGTFSLAQTGAVTPATGNYVETVQGVSASNNWTPQSQWNGDKCDGTGLSGFTLDPSKGNVYQIGIQYLGFGPIVFKIEVPHTGNNPDFIVAHSLNFNNSQTSTSVSQPSFPFTMAASSAGSTTNAYVYCASYAGFIEGEQHLTGPRMTYTKETNNFVGSTAATYYPLFTVRNSRTHAHNGNTIRANQTIVNLLSISGSHDDATPVGFFLLKNAALGGTPSYSRYSPSSITYIDTAATTATITDNEQILFAMHTGQASGQAFSFTDTITIQPGETVTLAARAVTGTATYVNASVNTREDQ